MKLKRFLCLLCCILLCVALTACNVIPPDGGGQNPPGGDQQPAPGEGGEIPDDNDVDIVDPDDTVHNVELVSQENGVITYKCADCNEEYVVTITCESGTENAYTVDGTTITFHNLSEKSAYDVSGTMHGNLVIDVTDDYKFELQMSGFELYSYEECPITILSGDKVTLSAKKNTENYVYDMRASVADDDEAVSAAIYAKCDLDVQGKGSLNVKSLHNNGIHTKDDLTVKNLSLQVDCMDNALKGDDNVTVQSGTVVLIARQGDGIKTSNSDVSKKGNQRGTVAICGGDILIYAACDGIDAAYDVTIDESEGALILQIFTDKYSQYSEEVTAASSLFYSGANYTATKRNAPGGPGGNGGPGGFGGMDEGNTDKGDYSTKGLKADNAITISAGKVTISAYDDAIHANNDSTLDNGSAPLGNVTISGGTLTLRSNDDGIHADGSVVISGGSVDVVGSYEGIEGNTVTISGGEVSVVSSDDGINGTATSGTAITISGGKLYVYAGGDGLDSNSQTSYQGIKFLGGVSVIISTGQSDASIDTERGYTYSGGYVVGIGRSGGMSSEATNCSNFSSVGTSKTLSLQKDAYLVVSDVVTVKLPVAVNALVVCLGKTSASISSATSTSYQLDANGVYWNATV